MRYRVVLNQGYGRVGFSIWDEKLSPLAVEEGKRPVHCSLDGKNELVFPRMGEGWLWLAQCERNGLDMEADVGDIAQVYVGSDGSVGELRFNHTPGDGPVIRELPVLWEAAD